MRSPPLSLLAALTLPLAFPLAASAATYDAAADFSAAANPGGPWSYGWSVGLGTPFIRSTISGVTDGLDYWAGAVPEPSNPGHFPVVSHNGSGRDVVSSGTLYLPAGGLSLHPGPGGEHAVLRFTVAEAGPYRLDARFTGVDIGPTRTDVHVLVDGVSIFDDRVDAFGSGPSFVRSLNLAAGQTVDFSVGFGANGSFFNDSTALDARVAMVPEPGSAALLAAGLGCVGLARRRRAHATPARWSAAPVPSASARRTDRRRRRGAS